MPMAEADYQRGTPQDTNACNFVPKRDFKGQHMGTRNCWCYGTTLFQGPCGRVRARAGARCHFRLTGASEICLVDDPGVA
jgi:hypothetical protein